MYLFMYLFILFIYLFIYYYYYNFFFLGGGVVLLAFIYFYLFVYLLLFIFLWLGQHYDHVLEKKVGFKGCCTMNISLCHLNDITSQSKADHLARPQVQKKKVLRQLVAVVGILHQGGYNELTG